MYKNAHSASQAKYKKSKKGKVAESKYNNSDAKKLAAKRYYWANLDKVKVRAKLWYAIKKSEIQRGNCEICDSENAQAHHKDYSKPYDVQWFCNLHHSHIHREWI